MDEMETNKQRTKKHAFERSWGDRALEMGEQIAIVAVTGVVSGFCLALGGAAFNSLQKPETTSEVTPLRRIG